MWGYTLAAIAFGLSLVVMSGAFMGGAVIVAVPLAALLVAGGLAFDFARRRRQAGSIQTYAEAAKTEKVDFTARDKRTLTSE